MKLQSHLLDFLKEQRQEVSGKVVKILCLEPNKYFSVVWGEEDHDKTPSPSNFQENSSSESKKHSDYTDAVLFIDDSEVFGSVIERFFTSEGLSVCRRINAQKALEELEQGTLLPRLIVCDVHMPEMNGVQFLRELRKMTHLPPIRLFMLTSDEEVETELEAIHAGVEAYIRKSEDPRLLVAHVQRALEKRQAFSEAA